MKRKRERKVLMDQMKDVETSSDEDVGDEQPEAVEAPPARDGRVEIRELREAARKAGLQYAVAEEIVHEMGPCLRAAPLSRCERWCCEAETADRRGRGTAHTMWRQPRYR